VPAGAPTMDGVDLKPYLVGSKLTRPHRELFWRSGRRTAVRVGDWKLVRNPRGSRDSAAWQLYDLSQDISESHDLAESRHQKLEELKTVWTRYDQQMAEPFWNPRK